MYFKYKYIKYINVVYFIYLYSKYSITNTYIIIKNTLYFLRYIIIVKCLENLK